MLAGLLLALFLVPGLLWIVRDRLPGAHPWLLNRSLVGLSMAPAPETWSAGHWMSGKWQHQTSAFFDQNFPTREALMRGINELYFRAFRTPAWRASTFSVGRSDAIFTTEYLNEYFMLRPPASQTAAIAEALTNIARLCHENGVPFVLVLSPTKPDVCPEWIPPAWHARLRPETRACDTLRRLLTEAGVPFIDGRETLKNGVASGRFQAPAFALGGIHWTKESALPVANAIVESLRRQGLRVVPLEAEELIVTNTPRDSDADVLALMNLAWKWEYPSPRVRIRPQADSPESKPAIVFIGGSFVTAPAALMSESRQFATISHFTYLRKAKAVFRDGVREVERKPSPTIDYGAEVFTADAVVVELNDYFVVKADYCLWFAEDARAYFADPRTRESVKVPESQPSPSSTSQ